MKLTIKRSIKNRQLIIFHLNFKTMKQVLLIALALIGLYSCKKDEPTNVDPISITGLSLVDKTFVEGEKGSLNLTITPIDLNQSIDLAWESSNKTVATVGSDWVVTPLKDGTTTITVTDKNNPAISGSCLVTVLAKVVTFEDANLEALMLAAYDGNGDKRITLEEIRDVKTLNLSGKSPAGKEIKSLKGIEGFKSLETFDVSNNPMLELISLYEIKEVKAKADEKIEYADGATKLKSVNFSGTAIKTVELDSCKVIETIDLSKSAIAAFDFTKVPTAKTINISETAIATTDFSENADLETLVAQKSVLKIVDLSNNSKMKAVDFTGSEKIEKVLYHKDVTPDANWKADNAAIFTEGKYDPRALIFADAAFEADLLGFYDINGDGKLYAEEAVKIEFIYVGAGVKSISGYENLPALTHINIPSANTNIKSLDFSGNTKLEYIESQSTTLTDIKIKGCTSLTEFRWAGAYQGEDLVIEDLPQLSLIRFGVTDKVETVTIKNCPELDGVDFTKFTNLNSLIIEGCDNFDYINCENLSKLKTFAIKTTANGVFVNISNTAIESVDFSLIPKMGHLSANDSKMKSIDISNNTEISEIRLQNNTLLESLKLASDTKLLSNIEISGSKLTSIDLSGAKELTKAWLYNNKLTKVNVNDLVKLTSLEVQGNAIVNDDKATGLDVSSNKMLQTLNFSSNKVTTIDVSNNEWLTSMNGNDNPLATVLIKKDQKTTGFSIPEETEIKEKK